MPLSRVSGMGKTWKGLGQGLGWLQPDTQQFKVPKARVAPAGCKTPLSRAGTIFSRPLQRVFPSAQG